MPLPKNANKGGRPTLADLNRVLPWQSVRQALEIPGTSKGLPETVTCPLCRGALTAYPLEENVWLHCDGCRWAGDSLDLVCQVWDFDAPAALRRFESIGYPIRSTLPRPRPSRALRANRPNDAAASVRSSWHVLSHFHPRKAERSGRCTSCWGCQVTLMASVGPISLAVLSAVLGEMILFWRH